MLPAPRMVGCPEHMTEHEAKDACWRCLRDLGNAADLAVKIRQHPSAAYDLGADSCKVMLGLALQWKDAALYAALLASLDENEDAKFPPAPPPPPFMTG